MQGSRVKVLYIDGQGKSSNTILHDVLGQIDDFFDGSEHREFGGVSRPTIGPAGGALINECAVWSGILDQAFSGLHNVDAAKTARLRGGALNVVAYCPCDR